MNNNQSDGIIIEGMVIGYIAYYKKHYCVVSINSKAAIIKDEDHEVVVDIKAEEGQFIDVQAFNKLVPDIVIKYINEKYDNIEILDISDINKEGGNNE